MPPQMQPQQPSQDKMPVFDGQTDFSGGMDSSRSPELIGQNQIALGINVTMRNGYPSTRPPINLLNLDFSGNTDAEDWWNTHYFQGASYFNVNGAYPSILASVGGHIFLLTPTGINFQVVDITPNKKDGTLDPNSSILTKAYFCQADTYLIIQDGQSLPYIYDGSTLRRSNPAIPEVPVGTVMAYGEARLSVANGNQFLVGDINGGATNVLSFTETTYLNGGGAFLLPMDMGVITGMIFTAQQDTNTGQGTLLVFGERGVISVNLTIPRTQWQSSSIVTVTLTDIGTLSDRTLTTINADVFFRSQDGIRTYRDARAEFGQYSLGNYGRTALSYEINEYLQQDNLAYQKYISGIVFDNRYLMTTQPTLVNGIGVPVFQAVAAMDFIPVSALRYNQAPVFDGLWTGLSFYQLVQGQFANGIRGFAFAYNLDNAGNQLLQLWEMTTVEGNDNNGLCPIQCAVETKSFIFGSSLSYKKLQYLRYWADQLQGRVDWTVRLRPDQYPGWVLWQEWTDQAPDQTCLLNGCSPPNLQPQYRPGRNLVLAPEQCGTNGQTLTTARTAFSFQLRWEWAGVARMTKMILTATPMDIPKVDCLVIAPPDDPIANIIAVGKASGNIPPANQYLNTEQTYQCPANYSGTPVTIPAGTYSSPVSVAAANALALAAAQAAAVCTLNAPTVQSDSENIANSVAFSYQIVATNSPTSYSATGLPSGLSINTSTGLISGTATGMTIGHVYSVPLSATNIAGTGNATLTITVKPAVRVDFDLTGGNTGGKIFNGYAGMTANIEDAIMLSIDGGSFFHPSYTGSYTAFTNITYKIDESFPIGTTYVSGVTVGLQIGNGMFLTALGGIVTYKASSYATASGSWVGAPGQFLAETYFQDTGGLIPFPFNGVLSNSSPQSQTLTGSTQTQYPGDVWTAASSITISNTGAYPLDPYLPATAHLIVSLDF